MHVQGGIEMLVKTQSLNIVNFVEACEQALSPKSR